MSHNQGTWDRIVRVALGLALLCLFLFGPKSAWGLVGFGLIVTGAVGWCPVYQLLGCSTYAERPSKTLKGT